MTYRTLLPSSWLGDKDADDSPFGALRKQIDTLFEDFDTGFSTLPASFALRSNVSETDEAICITAELPGVELDDVDVSVTGNRITVKGEKKSEDEEEGEKDGRQFHVHTLQQKILENIFSNKEEQKIHQSTLSLTILF